MKELIINKPKIILLDILLPDISGYKLCKRIKHDQTYKDIKIYFITAVPEQEVIKMMTETKADGYFLKPFEFQKFNIIFELLKRM